MQRKPAFARRQIRAQRQGRDQIVAVILPAEGDWRGASQRIQPLPEFPALLRHLETAGCTVLTASCGQRNLEEVFMHLTRRSLRD